MSCNLDHCPRGQQDNEPHHFTISRAELVSLAKECGVPDENKSDYKKPYRNMLWLCTEMKKLAGTQKSPKKSTKTSTIPKITKRTSTPPKSPSKTNTSSSATSSESIKKSPTKSTKSDINISKAQQAVIYHTPAPGSVQPEPGIGLCNELGSHK